MTETTNIPAAAPQPTLSELSPISVLFNRSIEVLSAMFWQLVALTFLPLVGFVALALVVGLYFVAASFFTSVAAKSIIFIILGLVGLVVLVFSIYFSLLCQSAIYLAVKQYPARSATKELLVKSKEFVMSYFVVSLLVSLLTFLWTLLFIIPGIIFMVRYSFAQWSLFVEGKKDMSALHRSQELVKGRWWKVFARLIVPGLMYFLFFLAIDMFKNSEPIYSILTVVRAVVQIIFQIFITIYYFYLYQDLASKPNV